MYICRGKLDIVFYTTVKLPQMVPFLIAGHILFPLSAKLVDGACMHGIQSGNKNALLMVHVLSN